MTLTEIAFLIFCLIVAIACLRELLAKPQGETMLEQHYRGLEDEPK